MTGEPGEKRQCCTHDKKQWGPPYIPSPMLLMGMLKTAPPQKSCRKEDHVLAACMQIEYGMHTYISLGPSMLRQEAPKSGNCPEHPDQGTRDSKTGTLTLQAYTPSQRTLVAPLRRTECV